MSRRSATSERIFLARRMPRLHKSWRRRVLAEGVSAAAMAPALVPGLRAHGAAPAWPGKDNPVLSWCIPAGGSAHASAGPALPLFRAWGLARHCQFPPLGSTATDYCPNSPRFATR